MHVLFSIIMVYNKFVTLLIDGSGEDGDLDSNEVSRQQKPWGYTRHFCPVAFRNSGVLWPGNNEIASRYYKV